MLSWVGDCSVFGWGIDRVDFVFVGALLKVVNCWGDEVAWI